MFAFLATYLYSKQSLIGTLKSSDKKKLLFDCIWALSNWVIYDFMEKSLVQIFCGVTKF